MNLLVLGNGFDLAHDMPTKYSDFLWFISKVIKIKTKNYSVYIRSGIYTEISSSCDRILNDKNELINMFFKDLDRIAENTLPTQEEIGRTLNNIWLQYFLVSYNNLLKKGTNWIDLENEIELVINRKLKDTSMNSSKELYIEENNLYIKDSLLSMDKIAIDYTILSENINITITPAIKKDLFAYLYSELVSFSKMLEQYLLLVEKEHITPKLEFRNILKADESIDTILNFNYTDTYNKLYKKTGNVDFINGQLGSNIILGIQNKYSDKIEYYCDNNVHKFFKYFQRTDIDTKKKVTDRDIYMRWISNEQFKFDKRYLPDNHQWDLLSGPNPVSSICAQQTGLRAFIIGHSLDLSDKQILNKILLSPYAETVTIYYYNNNDRIDKLTNLLKLLGEEQFNQHVNSPNTNVKPHIYLEPLSSLEIATSTGGVVETSK